MAEHVAVATASSAFEAQVLEARLAAEGIRCQLRGNVGGPYPMGPVQVLVSEADAPAVRELLLADQVEDVFEGPAWDGARQRSTISSTPWWLASAVLAFVALVIGRIVMLAL